MKPRKDLNSATKPEGTFDDVAPSWFDDDEWHHASKDYRDIRDKAFRNSINQNSFSNSSHGSKSKVNMRLSGSLAKPRLLNKLRSISVFGGFSLLIGVFTNLDKRSRLVAASVIVIVLGIVGLTVYDVTRSTNDFPKEVAGASSATGAGTEQPNHDPAFDIVKPQGKELEKEQIFYDPSRNFTKFNDELNGVPVIVSQQPMPEIYKSSPADGVAKIAKDFGASELITFDGLQMYYGKDEKGPQTMIFTKNNLLVFVSTTKEVDKEALKVYVGNFN